MLELDYSNVLESAVGSHGISAKAFTQAGDSTRHLVSALESDGQTRTAALGVTDQHSQLQLFIEGPNDKSLLFWAVRKFRNSLKIDHPYSSFDSMKHLEKQSIAGLFDAERCAKEIAITEAGRPDATAYVDRIDEESLGDLIMFFQCMTGYADELYDINAFDQPGVEYGKKLTFAMMGRTGFENFKGTIEAARQRERAIVQ